MKPIEEALEALLDQADDPGERDKDSRLQALYDITNADYPNDDSIAKQTALMEYLVENYSRELDKYGYSSNPEETE